MSERIAIIGAGAAGCFCAIEIKRRNPSAQVTVYEAGRKPLAKVAVTGGGRCNFTNSFRDIARLEEAYPRGARLMKRALMNFSNEDCIKWFAAEGVASVIQDDQCVFPRSQDAMQIVRTLERLMAGLGVKVRTDARVSALREGWTLEFADGSNAGADKVVVTSGGGAVKMLEGLDGIEIIKPVPSLFTLKINDSGLRALMGTVVENTALSLAGTGFRSKGTLLLTDWGVSGPVTLKLSSYAARELSEKEYRGTLLVNWLGRTEDEARSMLASIAASSPRKQAGNTQPTGITSRLWQYLLSRAQVPTDRCWAEIGNKAVNKLVATLTADSYEISGRCHFKEEFVTAGGVALSSINLNTLESKAYPGLFFAGEVLDIDAITGGFNLQAAWSTGYTVAKNLL